MEDDSMATSQSGLLMRKRTNSFSKDLPKTLGPFQLSFLAFFMVTGGPNGSEDAVGGGGGFYALLGFAIFPLFYCVPQAMMTAEMSTMIPENGGYILWISRAFGPYAGFINAWNSTICNMVDLALYPILFTDYIVGKDNLDDLSIFLIQVGITLLIVAVNVAGVDMAAHVCIFLSVMVCLPFTVFFILRADKIDPSTQWWPPRPSSEVDWAQFCSCLVWMHTGWDGLSTVAGEVKNPRRTYIGGIIGANLLIAGCNLIPVIAGLTISLDDESWEAGGYSGFGGQVEQWLGYWIMAASMSSVAGLYNANLCESSRAVWAMSQPEGGKRMLPECIGFTWKKTGAPVSAVVILGTFAMLLMRLDFTFMQQVDNVFNSITILLEFAAFMKMRYSHPNAPRPFKMPGGMVGAWIATVMKTLIICGAFIAYDVYTILIGLGFNALLTIVYLYLYWPLGSLSIRSVISRRAREEAHPEGENPVTSDEYFTPPPPTDSRGSRRRGRYNSETEMESSSRDLDVDKDHHGLPEAPPLLGNDGGHSSGSDDEDGDGDGREGGGIVFSYASAKDVRPDSKVPEEKARDEEEDENVGVFTYTSAQDLLSTK